MKVGDLVRWESAGGEYELGIVTDLDGDGAFSTITVYFLMDGHPSCITKDDLEVIKQKPDRICPRQSD